MLKIEAIFRPERISEVSAALEEIGCQGFHYQNVTGQGRQRGVEVFVGRGGQMTTRAALPKTLLVAVVSSSMKDAVVKALVDATRSPEEGQIGDGKIFISEVADAIRVRTGETGESAI